MDEVTRLNLLRRLAATHDERQRGKIVQRLLAIAFHQFGYRLVEERLVEGTDLDIVHRERPEEKYSLEVRTTAGFTVPVKAADLRQMDERAQDGYATGVAALRIASGSKWVLVSREWLAAPVLRVSAGSSPGLEELADRVNEAFDEVLARHGEAAVAQGLDGLSALVRTASEG